MRGREHFDQIVAIHGAAVRVEFIPQSSATFRFARSMKALPSQQHGSTGSKLIGAQHAKKSQEILWW